jgi:hypothetical protein
MIGKLLVTLEGLIATIPQALVSTYISEMPCYVERVYTARFSAEAGIAVVLSTTVNNVELVCYMFSCSPYVIFAGTLEQVLIHALRPCSVLISTASNSKAGNALLVILDKLFPAHAAAPVLSGRGRRVCVSLLLWVR